MRTREGELARNRHRHALGVELGDLCGGDRFEVHAPELDAGSCACLGWKGSVEQPYGRRRCDAVDLEKLGVPLGSPSQAHRDAAIGRRWVRIAPIDDCERVVRVITFRGEVQPRGETDAFHSALDDARGVDGLRPIVDNESQASIGALARLGWLNLKRCDHVDCEPRRDVGFGAIQDDEISGVRVGDHEDIARSDRCLCRRFCGFDREVREWVRRIEDDGGARLTRPAGNGRSGAERQRTG